MGQVDNVRTGAISAVSQVSAQTIEARAEEAREKFELSAVATEPCLLLTAYNTPAARHREGCSVSSAMTASCMIALLLLRIRSRGLPAGANASEALQTQIRLTCISSEAHIFSCIRI
jgi:hypothetical protein